MPLRPHGDNGAYVGGDWVPIEDLGESFLCKTSETSGSKHGCVGGGKCSTCPRSRSKKSAAHPDGSYDIVVIGAGGIGCAIARELSKTTAKVLILEAADDVTQGATKGNSGIIHAGFDDKPGSVRAKFCPTGCRMFPALDKELHFGYQKNTSLVVAKGPEDEKTLERLLEQGKKNGVENLHIIDQAELRRREPSIHEDATAALLAEDAGNIIPYEYCIALAENAVDNGVELRIRRKVTGIQKAEGGGFTVTASHWEPAEYKGGKKGGFNVVGLLKTLAIAMAAAAMSFVTTENVISAGIAFALAFLTMVVSGALKTGGSDAKKTDAKTGKVSFEPSPRTVQGGQSEEETIRTKFVVNAAGCYSDEIAAMVGDKSFRVNQRYGEYVLLNKSEGKRLGVSSTIFPCPGPMGKGVLVQNTLWGNLILGPTARDTLKKDPVTGDLVPNMDTMNEKPDTIIRAIMAKCRDMVPGFDAKQVIHTFCGARAKTTRGDWIIEPCPTAPQMIHAAGIDSPGLAASPAIALEIVRLLKQAGAPVTEANPTFNPIRAPIIIPKKGMKDAFGNPIRMGPVGAVKDPVSNVVCKCEKVTEAEIVEALHRSLPIDSTQAIRKRTRAGMGHCQADPANYCCEDRVASIIARETGLSIDEVGRRPWPGSSLMPRRFFKEEDREWVDKLSQQ